MPRNTASVPLTAKHDSDFFAGYGLHFINHRFGRLAEFIAFAGFNRHPEKGVA